MKTTLLALFTAVITLSSYAQNYQVSTDGHSITWHAEKVTGEHEGTIALQKGQLIMSDGKLIGGSLVIDMNTILCTDLEGEWSDKLVKHLKSPDFFGVDKHPTSQIVINNVESQGKDDYKINATLTIKNISQDINFDAVVSDDGNSIHATAELIIDRTKFGIKYGSGSFFDDLGDKTIYDEFTMKIDFKAVALEN